jgi:hypothetical protein
MKLKPIVYSSDLEGAERKGQMAHGKAAWIVEC